MRKGKSFRFGSFLPFLGTEEGTLGGHSASPPQLMGGLPVRRNNEPYCKGEPAGAALGERVKTLWGLARADEPGIYRFTHHVTLADLPSNLERRAAPGVTL